MCEEYHDALKSLSYNKCPFCEMEFSVVVDITMCCCDDMNIVEDCSIRRCMNCHWFEYPYATEYINYYETRHRIVRKSIYVRNINFSKQ